MKKYVIAKPKAHSGMNTPANVPEDVSFVNGITDVSRANEFNNKENAAAYLRYLENLTGLRYQIYETEHGFSVDTAMLLDLDGMCIEEGDVLYDKEDNAVMVDKIKRTVSYAYDWSYIMTDVKEHRSFKIDSYTAKAIYRHYPWKRHQMKASIAENRPSIVGEVAEVCLNWLLLVLPIILMATVWHFLQEYIK